MCLNIFSLDEVDVITVPDDSLLRRRKWIVIEV